MATPALEIARKDHELQGGVLLSLGDNCYWVGEFVDAAEMRSDIAGPGACGLARNFATAWYWARLGQCGYDETRIDWDQFSSPYDKGKTTTN